MGKDRGAVDLGKQREEKPEGLEAHETAEANVDARLAELHENADIAREVEAEEQQEQGPPPGIYTDLPTAEVDNEAIAADAAAAAGDDKFHAHTAFLIVVDEEGNPTAVHDLSLIDKLIIDRDATPRDFWRYCTEVANDVHESSVAAKTMSFMQQQAMMAQRMMQDQALARKLQEKGIKVDLPGAVSLG